MAWNVEVFDTAVALDTALAGYLQAEVVSIMHIVHNGSPIYTLVTFS